MESEKSVIFIKNEGYAKILVERNHEKANSASHWLNSIGLTNDLAEYTKTYCSEPVWTLETEKGFYHSSINKPSIKRFIKDAKTKGFIVSSEF